MAQLRDQLEGVLRVGIFYARNEKYFDCFLTETFKAKIHVSYASKEGLILTEKAKVLKIVDAKGSHYEIGHQLGTKCRDMATNLLKEAREAWKFLNISLEEAISRSKKYLPYAEAFSPEYIDEIRGYSDAVGFKFEEVFAWFCQWDITLREVGWYGSRRRQAGQLCTNVVVNGDVTADGTVYACHNSDIGVQYEKYVTVVRIKPDNEPGFIALSLAGLLWVDNGVNAAGIGVLNQGLIQNDMRIGVPLGFAVRKVLEAKTIGEAMKAAIPENRACSNNIIVCDENGEIYSMEGSATDFDALYAEEGYLAHSNYYLSPKMAKYEAVFQAKNDISPYVPDFIIRQNRMTKLVKKELGKITVETLKKIMSDHLNYPLSICRHIDERLPREMQGKTAFSDIVDVTHRAIWVCHGNPCVGKYTKFELK